MIRSRRLRSAPLLACVLLLAACGDATGPEGVPRITSLPRALTVAEERVVSSANAFGVDLMSEVVERDDRPNIVLSPLSASSALGMTLNGAAGSTFEAMRTALRFGTLSQGEINAAFRGLVDVLLELDPSVELSIANATWANEQWPFHPAFFDSVSTYFDAEATSADFADPATVGAINAWAEEHTEGRIDRILDQLDPDMVMILLNAIWFDGRWTTAFDPDDTGPAPFRRADDTEVTVDMMRLRDVELPYGGASGFTAVELPYGGQAWSMVVAVPWGSEPIREVVAEMDGDDWAALMSSLQPTEVDEVALPRFTLSYDVFLNDPLTDMGMGVAFTGAADFTNLSPRGDELCIDFVRQKTFIEVDEVGTRAAAVTAVGVEAVSFTGLIVDRPFLFAIRERLSGTILFMGVVGDPTLEDAGPVTPADGCAIG